MSMHIDKLCLQLGVEDGLAAVEPAIAGEQVAEGAGGGEIDQTAGPKSSMLRITEAMGQFTAPQNTATRPMAAAKPGGSPSSPPARSRRSPHEERRHHLAALEAAADGHGGERQLQSHAQRSACPGHGPRHHVHARAVIVRSTQRQRGGYDHAKPPAAARRKRFFRHRAARCSVMCRPRQNRILTSARAHSQHRHSPRVGQASPAWPR